MKSSPKHQMFTYFHWDSGDETIVFAIEACAHDDEEHPPWIIRHYCENDLLHEDVGRSLGHGLGYSCALLIKAGAGDLLTLFEIVRGKISSTTCRINHDHTLEVVANAPKGEIRMLLKQQHSVGRLRVNEKDLEILFCQDCPAWLEGVLDRQLAFWRKHHTEHYFHYCPLNIPSEEIFRGVKGAPFWILARFGRRLNSMQRTLCCKRTPLAPIFLHWRPMTLDDRTWKLGKYAAEILKYAADRFDEDDLRICAQAQPLVALEYRYYLDQKRRDAALAGMALAFAGDELGLYPMRWKIGIMDSIHRDPALWVRTFEGVFDRLLVIVRKAPSACGDQALILMLLERLKGKELESLERYLCLSV